MLDRTGGEDILAEAALLAPYRGLGDGHEVADDGEPVGHQSDAGSVHSRPKDHLLHHFDQQVVAEEEEDEDFRDIIIRQVLRQPMLPKELRDEEEFAPEAHAEDEQGDAHLDRSTHLSPLFLK